MDFLRFLRTKKFLQHLGLAVGLAIVLLISVLLVLSLFLVV